jgi:hypothetical protein
MNSENEATLKLFAREIVAEMVRSNGAQMLPATTAGVLQACSSMVPTSGCENLLYAPITTHRFYRGGRTDINVVLEGKVPLVPGRGRAARAGRSAAVGDRLLQPALPVGQQRQQPRRGPGRVVSSTTELLDTKHYGSEIYNSDGTVIGDGLLPIPLAMGQHCCVGGNNRLRVRITHTRQQQPDREYPPVRAPRQRASSAARRARWAARATAAARASSFRGGAALNQ